MCTTMGCVASEQVTDEVRHGKNSGYYIGRGQPVCVGGWEELSSRTAQEKSRDIRVMAKDKRSGGMQDTNLCETWLH